MQPRLQNHKQSMPSIPKTLDRLCVLYLDRAMSNACEPPELSPWIRKLEDLSIDRKSEFFDSTDAKLLLTRYYISRGQSGKARDLARPSISSAFELLSDQDPTNDWQGYDRLGRSLMTFGDEKMLSRLFRSSIHYTSTRKNQLWERRI